ncbi:MAG: hypothetical protein AUK60_05260 [Rhodobacteraceae bacterium CG2_30_10_405]|nr:hypothetical protein [Rhodobacterales bacterium]NCO17416.1 hypothetical protein [Alphaproteobacteria bacterium]OIQ06800.1 MAG: hypothetical protein AUK60_05260 [Rhodobacteraceae bacterium CG2_30_10_405]
MRRPILCLALLLTLAACGAKSVWAPDADVARAAYAADTPPSVTLFTVLNKRSHGGAHSGLLINGTQRVMFDPAGSWHHPALPERNDLFYGMTDKMVNFYIDYHSRETFDVLEQTVPVSPEVAALVMQRATAHGAVPKALCASSISDILRGVPGFEAVPNTFAPKKLVAAFEIMPGMSSRLITDTDADNNHGVLLVQAGDPRLD